MLPIAKEFQGIFLFSTIILIGIQMWIGPVATLLWVFWLAFGFLVRDFHRDIPPIPLANISPVDGTVIAVNKCNDPYLDRPALCYTLQQSRWGEFNFHSPTEGKVEQLWVQDPNNHAKALAFWVRTDEDDDVIVHIELNSRLQYASTALHPGERVGQGRRCGFAGHGCRVYVYLPQSTKAVAQVEDNVTAGRNIIAKFVH